MIAEGYDGPALAAARRLDLAVIRLAEDATMAGKFTLAPEKPAEPAAEGTPSASDIALILHTSGTTSRPKIVPLLHSNVAASAQNIAASLTLSAQDRCLNVMPLFHIHGLLAAVSGSLSVGRRSGARRVLMR